MARIEEGDHCPQCREGRLSRVRRRGWMRWIPKSRHYKCKNCQAGYLTIWVWTLRLKAKKKPEPEEE
jgi:hypothetical protein